MVRVRVDQVEATQILWEHGKEGDNSKGKELQVLEDIPRDGDDHIILKDKLEAQVDVLPIGIMEVFDVPLDVLPKEQPEKAPR